MAVLKYWDDPDMLFNQYIQKIKAEDKRKIFKRGDSMDKRMIEPT
jgi:hypothetical protein